MNHRWIRSWTLLVEHRSMALPALMLLITLLTTLTAAQGRASQAAVIDPEDQTRLVEQYGFRIVTIRMAASNHMVDVRYWIVDAEKAHDVFREGLDLKLEHPASGSVLTVPHAAFIGSMSQTAEPPKQDRQYFVFFKNNGAVSAGDTVRLHLGDIVVGPLTVR